MQRLPGNQTTILTRQENKTRRNLRRLSRSPHWRPTELIQGILLHRRRDQRRPDRTRSNGIDSDAERDLLVGETAGEGDDGAFGGGVVEEIGAADVGVYRGAVDDRVAGFHVLEGVLGDVEGGVDVGVKGFEPLVPSIASDQQISRSWRHGAKYVYSVSSRMPLVMFWYAALFTTMLMAPISETA